MACSAAREAVDVERRADQARLLRAPPGEADLVVRLHLLHRLGHLEDGRAPRTVVVDARPRADGVEVGADHDHVVGVARRRLGEHVERGLGLAHRVGEHPHPQRWRVRQCGAQRVGGAEHRDAAGVVGREGDRGDSLAVGTGGVALVEDHDAGGSGRGGILGLQLERARSTLEQGDVPGREAGEVRRLTATGRRVADAELQVHGGDGGCDVARIGLVDHTEVDALDVGHRARRRLLERRRTEFHEGEVVERLDHGLVPGGPEPRTPRSPRTCRDPGALRIGCRRWRRRSFGGPAGAPGRRPR